MNNNKDLKKVYNFWAGTYDDYAKINMAIIKDHPVFVRMLKDEKDKNTGLDLGCGTGILTVQLSQFAKKIIGLDISQKMLEKAKGKKSLGAELDFKWADIAKKLDFPDEHFDFVVSSLALNHIENYQSVFQEVYRVLKKKGVFIFDEPDSGPRTPEQLKYKAEPKIRDPLLSAKRQGLKVWQARPLKEMLRSLEEVGFNIEEIVETKIDQEISHLIKNYQYHENRPLFAIVKTRKK